MVGTLDDLDLNVSQGCPQAALELLALVAAIGEELQKEGEEAEQAGHQHDAAVAVLDVGGMDDGVHQETLRVDDDVPLLSFDFLAAIVPRRVDRAPPFSALFTLWLSMIAAVGLASRSACSRHRT